MSYTDLPQLAEQLPQAWRSQIIARLGSARIKVLRMDTTGLIEEQHPYPEALLVLEGTMNLLVGDDSIPVSAGSVYVVPPGQRHSVGPGSHGTLVIIDIDVALRKEIG